MPIKTSEEVFNESIAKGEAIAKKNAEKSKRIRELRQQLSQAIIKSTFANSENEKARYSAQAQGLKRQIEALEALNH